MLLCFQHPGKAGQLLEASSLFGLSGSQSLLQALLLTVYLYFSLPGIRNLLAQVGQLQLAFSKIDLQACLGFTLLMQLLAL